MQNNLFLCVTWHRVQPLSSNRLKIAFKVLIQFQPACCELPGNNTGASLPSLKGIRHKALRNERFDFRFTLTHISQLRCSLQI